MLCALGAAPTEGKVPEMEAISFWSLCRVMIHSSFERVWANLRRHRSGAHARQLQPEAECGGTERDELKKPREADLPVLTAIGRD